ncbi:MAG TPA: hypothetical protein VFA18_00865 [Gemmataceae bacterium]|nr:hypothetical protein [Gemmataceae bacterium]
MAPQVWPLAPNSKHWSALRGRARRLSWLGLGTLAELLFTRRNKHSRYQTEEEARARRRRHRPHLEELEKHRSSGTVPAIGSVLTGPLGAVLAAEIMGPALLADTPATVADSGPASGTILDSAPLAPLAWSEDGAAPPPTHASTPANAGLYDGFVTKFSPTGATLAYSSYIGGGLSDSANAIVLDGNKHAFLTGYTYSTDFPTTTASYDPVDPEQNGNSAAFVAEIWNWTLVNQLRTDDPLQAPPDYTPWGTGPNGSDGEFEGSAQTGNLRLVHPLDFLQHCPDS